MLYLGFRLFVSSRIYFRFRARAMRDLAQSALEAADENSNSINPCPKTRYSEYVKMRILDEIQLRPPNSIDEGSGRGFF